MSRKTHCFVCGKEVDEATRFNSLQHFDHVVCSVKCGVQLPNTLTIKGIEI